MSDRKTTSSEPVQMDRAAVEALANILLEAIKNHYFEYGGSPARVFEVLNALGVASATVIGATAPDHATTFQFLNQVIADNMPGVLEAAAVLNMHDGGTSAH